MSSQHNSVSCAPENDLCFQHQLPSGFKDSKLLHGNHSKVSLKENSLNNV